MNPHSDKAPDSTKKTAFTRFLDTVEWLGNLLPHPVTLFALFAFGVVILSGVADYFGVSAIDPRPEGARGRAPDGVIEVVSLMNGDGLRRIVENLVTNFTGFVPLGTVLVALLGVGVAEKSGLISAAIRSLVLAAASFRTLSIPSVDGRAGLKRLIAVYLNAPGVKFIHEKMVFPVLNFILEPKRLVTITIVFAGIISNTASEMGYVVLVPLAAVIFMALGRHPLAGLAAAFAGVSGGYSANLLIGTIDPLLAGITEEAAQLIDPGYMVHPAVNWYFMIVSTFLITAVGAFVTLKIVEPKLGPYDPSMASEDLSDDSSMDPITDKEKRGLKMAGLAVLGVSFMIFMSAYPEWGVLRNPETGDVLDSPLLRGMVSLIFVFFLIPGYVYGRVTGTMKSDRDVIDGMAKAMSTLGLYIVLVFFAAQFVAFFGWSNLGPIVAVKGADLLVAINLTGPLVFIPFILMCCFVNLMLGSASAQWAITAPIFVPMLMLIGYSPEVIQAAYRIGDSTTNIITPMMSYFGLILAFATRYDRKLGIGTIISTMLPYSIFFLLGWIVLFYVWVFGLGMQVGPGAPTFYIP
ncbi:MAG: AbgT family transporter [Bacteroidetes bacterium]|nr:AbgT family transporter [Bacteroidota bacterium]MCH8523364.1 AbgT family transporter [Balneolales bacterium]